jgi:hypothetical protein
MAIEMEIHEHVATSLTRRRVVLIAVLVVALVLPYAWLRVKTQTINVVAVAGPVRPGEQIAVDLGDFSVGVLEFGFERAPLGRWFMTHDGSDRVRDDWYWPISAVDHWSKLPDATSTVTVAAPDDASGDKFAICDFSDDCVVLLLDHS